MFAMGCSATTALRLTTKPRDSANSGATRLMSHSGPITLVRNSSSITVSSVSTSAPNATTPAALTSPSSRPYRSVATAASASPARGSRTSNSMATASSMPSAVRRSTCGPARMTRAPRSASPRAMGAPRPPLAPTITTTAPESERGTGQAPSNGSHVAVGGNCRRSARRAQHSMNPTNSGLGKVIGPAYRRRATDRSQPTFQRRNSRSPPARDVRRRGGRSRLRAWAGPRRSGRSGPACR